MTSTSDAWADLAGYQRAVLRPRFFWDGGSGRTLFATTGFTYEDRDGGTIEGEVLPATSQPYVEALETHRYDAGAVGQFLVKQRYVVTGRAAVARQAHSHQFGEDLERDRHDTVFGELAVRGTAAGQPWVVGVAIERDAYMSRDVPRFDYTFTVPGAFGQYDINLTPGLSVSASGRLDVHTEYGTFFSPRVSALARNGHWTSRLSAGLGFFGPTPNTEETEAAGLLRLQVRQPLEAERGSSALVRSVSHGRAVLIHRDVVCLPDRAPDPCRTLPGVRPQLADGSDNERWASSCLAHFDESPSR